MSIEVLLSALFVAQAPCTPSKSAPVLDHVVVVVRDLDNSAPAFRREGFRIKTGRLHANNLLNRHIKFRDKTSIELMTLAGAPGDAMARDYAELLEQGEGGVYVALNTTNLQMAERAATAAGLQIKRSASGPWQFISFPPASPAATVFFTTGAPVQDPDSLLSHQPAVEGLREVWVEGGPGLNNLLKELGAIHCGTALSRQGQRGERWALRRGALVVVPARSGIRPRVIGVVLQSTENVARTLTPVPGFWLEYDH